LVTRRNRQPTKGQLAKKSTQTLNDLDGIALGKLTFWKLTIFPNTSFGATQKMSIKSHQKKTYNVVTQ